MHKQGKVEVNKVKSVQSVVQFQYDTPPESVLITDGGNRINGVQDRRGKDIILGGLFTIHNDAEGSAGAKCGERVWGHGIELLEAMFYALDSINSDPDLLPNITLGYDIRDTCQSDNIALDESVNLVFTNTDAESGTCRPLDASDNDSIQIPVAATIGPLESFISIPVASFFRLFQMSQVSYGSTSTELNNRNQYGYFFRTIPTNNAGVQAMIDIMLYYEWDHVSIIHSDDLFGSSFNRDFLLVAKAKEICIDANEPIRDDFDDSDYRELAQLLFFNTTANVIVLLASLDHAKNLLNYAQMVKDSNIAKRNFVWIVTDASAAAATEFTGDVIAGMWGIFPPSEPIITLDDYFSKLTASTNKRNPCNVLAILTIRFPQNFNESKYVAFSTFSFGLMWIAFIFTYLNTADKFQTAVVSFTIQMSAMVVLLCLFALVSSLYCSCPNVQ
uniref:G-protein coupled receptors family 3 profile domain-containing protein n=1 Tax=Amphimedon queenslandica TaxID=400682 RepID=A0A1X7TYM0_AMPQE